MLLLSIKQEFPSSEQVIETVHKIEKEWGAFSCIPLVFGERELVSVLRW